ncbi:MAG: hypothetical protein LC121_00490 [Anaerolineae bacterium]|jgi:SAM-dependent methyltransferase|nr:hypothetical protein [Anaerolineae bacterium]
MMSDPLAQPAPLDAPSTPPDDGQLDDLLQRSRRLDWRFLLPDPELGRVVYYGPADDPLRVALADFAESVTNGESVAPGAADRFDVAVLRHQPVEALARARSLLRPGGTLYVEVQRRAGRDLPWQARRYVATIERSGFRHVEAFWNWPDFTRCTKIMPLHDATALAYVIVNNRRGIAAWLTHSAVRVVFRLGMAGWFVPSLSLIGRREQP